MTEKNQVNSVIMPFSVKQKCLEMTEGFYFGQMTEMSPRKKLATNVL